jgi:hypothetical protein
MIDALNLHFEFVDNPCTACSKVILTAWQIPGTLICVIAEAIQRFFLNSEPKTEKSFAT